MMKATGWKGSTYGIRVGKQNAEHYFDRRWKTIEVEIAGHFHSFSLADTFWTTCPEFRGVVIGQWLDDNGLIPWPKGKPPQVELTPLGGNRFRLSR